MRNPASNNPVLCGSVAHDWLRGPSPRGRVHSVFDHVINLRSTGDRLISLTDATVPLHPFAVATDRLPERNAVEPDQQVRFDPPHLEGETGAWSLELGPLRTWNDGAGGTPEADSPAALRTSVPAFAERLQRYSRPEGLGPLARSNSLENTGSGTASRFEDPLPVRAERLLHEMGKCLLEDRREQLVSRARALAGLGPGLTPSGDDALRGWMAALWLTGGIHSGRKIRPLLKNLAGAVGPRTTWFSRQWIRQAARGALANPTRRLLRCLAGGIDGPPLRLAVKNVCRQGETSGLDLAVGLLFGTRACMEREREVV